MLHFILTELELGKEKEVSFLGKKTDKVLGGGFSTLNHFLESAMKVLHRLYADDQDVAVKTSVDKAEKSCLAQKY